MEELVERLSELVSNAARAAATSQPSGDPAYHLGKLQGRYAGLREALNVVVELRDKEFEDEAEEPEET